MKKNLTTKELSLLAKILKVDVEILKPIRKVIDVREARRRIIVATFQKAVQEGTASTKQIIASLMAQYGMSQSGIEKIVYSVVNKDKHCTRCGTGMSQYKYTRNKRVCDKCIIQKINQDENGEPLPGDIG